MAIAKNRNLYVAALALALGGLALDKTVLRGGLSPGSAEAASVEAGEKKAATAAAPAAASENTAEIAQRLERARDQLGLDAASVPDAFFGAGLNKKRGEPSGADSPAQAFKKKYTLHAVMAGRSEEGAVATARAVTSGVDLKKMTWEVGKAMDGWTLTSVDIVARTATFNSDTCSVVLALPPPALTGTGEATQGASGDNR